MGSRLVRFAVLVAIAAGCKSATSSGPPRTLTGTVTLPDSLKALPVVFGHLNDTTYVIHGTGAVIDSISGGVSPFTPTDLVTISGDTVTQAYSYSLPVDPRHFGTLIAWVDKNHNGKLDLATEPARYPVKQTTFGGSVIVIWGSTSITSDPAEADYLASDGSHFFELSQMGPGGFNFGF